MNINRQSIWVFRRSKDIHWYHKIIIISLFIAGVISIIRLADWWFKAEHINSLALYILLSFIFWYGMIRLIIIWMNYIRIQRPKSMPAKSGKSVAIFTTSSPGEPLSMFEKTLEACANIQYPHTTYLLDDTQDPRFKEAAEKYGAIWLELIGLPGAKAGKVNEALKRTSEEFILILDPDHIPFPNFLDETLGYFEDPEVGFVQVCQAYYNQYRSVTANGASQQTYGFYGPTQMSMYGYGTSVAIGANCTFRRTALESVGGHGKGLAEDLITSIRLHAAGWKSIYNPVIVSRGLVPEDFGSFCKQQLKWARGVHEVLFAEVPRLFNKLSFWQKISYTTIGTYYLVGFTAFVYFIIPYLYFWNGIMPASMYFADFLLNVIPVGIIGIVFYLYMQNWYCHPAMERGLHIKSMILKYASWPVYLLGFLLSVVNVDIPYIPTAKKAVIGKISVFVRPLILQLLFYIISVVYFFSKRFLWTPESALILSAEVAFGMIIFASINILLVIAGIYIARESMYLKEEEPWKNIELNQIKWQKDAK